MTRKLVLFVALIAALGALAAACAQAPVVVYIVVTATPTGAGGELSAPTSTSDSAALTAQAVAASTATAAPLTTPTPAGTPSPELNAVPTVTVRQIYVAEQPFQRGRMFWLEPIGQIWVLIETEPGIGLWQVYEDRFREGDPEFDPAIVAPEGLLQPIRGFGLIWRTGENVRQEIGWATDIEVGFVSNYEYHPGEGTSAGSSGPGFHFMQNQFGEWFRFNEINGTWQQVNRATATPTATPGEATE